MIVSSSIQNHQKIDSMCPLIKVQTSSLAILGSSWLSSNLLFIPNLLQTPPHRLCSRYLSFSLASYCNEYEMLGIHWEAKQTRFFSHSCLLNLNLILVPLFCTLHSRLGSSNNFSVPLLSMGAPKGKKEAKGQKKKIAKCQDEIDVWKPEVLFPH